MKKKIKILILVFLSIILTDCKIYSFTGASISPETKTFSVEYFQNNAPIASPSLSNNLTEKLKQRFLNQTQLKYTNSNGDLQFKGYISNYSITPIAIQSNETAAMNRLTISVFVEFYNQQDPKYNFQTTFSRYEDFNSNIDFSSIEESINEKIIDYIIDDIFNKSVVNW